MRLRTGRSVVGALLLAAVSAGCSDGGADDARPGLSPGPSRSVLSTTAPPSPSGSGEPAYYSQKLTWKGCGSGAECATLKVPLDYADPGSELIDIALLRIKATGKRQGSIVVNPGGPGGSGIDYAKSKPVTKRLRQHFDIVGFDPRGVGKSTPVRCVSSDFLDDYIAADASPDTPQERARGVELAQQFAEGCKAKSGRLLAHISTADAARDMDVLRAALGDAKLTYLGKSYGTYLGAVYAELFPTKVRALVLDGAVDPSLSAEELNRAQAKGFEVALDAFIADCVKRSSCPLGTGSAAEAEQTITTFLDGLDSKPLPASRYQDADGRRLTQAEGVLGVATALYSKSSWSFLRDALGSARSGDGSELLYLADILVDRNGGDYSNQTEANTAINCIDHPAPRDPAAYDRDAAEWSKESPHFGAFIAYGSLPCAFWPVAPTGKDQPTTAAGAPPILVIGTLRDPATPYSWAVSLADQLESGVLLTYNGDGHTVYGDGNSCVDSATDTYVLDLEPPPSGKRC